MQTYITFDENGGIYGVADHKFSDDAVLVDYDVVCVNGKLYKAGEEPDGPSENDLLFLSLRGARDMRIAATDFYLAPDYPISVEKLTVVKAYRKALRDFPAQEGAPWDGGGEQTPWPEKPTV